MCIIPPLYLFSVLLFCFTIQFSSSLLLMLNFKFTWWRLSLNIMLMRIWIEYIIMLFISQLLVFLLCVFFVHIIKVRFTLMLMLLIIQFLILTFSIHIYYVLFWAFLRFWILLVTFVFRITLFLIISITQPIFSCLFIGTTTRHQTC